MERKHSSIYLIFSVNKFAVREIAYEIDFIFSIGEIVYKTTTINSEKLEVNTSDFAKGMYMVQVRTNNFIETKKVIVTK